MTSRSSGPLALAMAAGLLALATALVVPVTTTASENVVLERREVPGGIEEIMGQEFTTTVDAAMAVFASLLLLIGVLCLAGAGLLALRRSRIARALLLAAGGLTALGVPLVVGSPDAVVLTVLVLASGLLAVAAWRWAREPRQHVA
jgi:hypothetical protein